MSFWKVIPRRKCIRFNRRSTLIKLGLTDGKPLSKMGQSMGKSKRYCLGISNIYLGLWVMRRVRVLYHIIILYWVSLLANRSFSFQLVACRDKLIHLNIVHRIYLTPYKLHRIYPGVASVGDVWVTMQIFTTFSGPTQILKLFGQRLLVSSHSSALLRSPSVDACLLRLVGALIPDRTLRTLVSLLPFYAR